jgi:hypothetical protein
MDTFHRPLLSGFHETPGRIPVRLGLRNGIDGVKVGAWILDHLRRRLSIRSIPSFQNPDNQSNQSLRVRIG